MEVEIIFYQKRLVKLGVLSCYLGLMVLFLNLIPLVYINYWKFIVSFGMLLIFSGYVSISYLTKKITKAGLIIFNKENTLIKLGLNKDLIINKDYSIKFSNSGYEGSSNYTPFLTIGAFTTNPGINQIQFYNNLKSYKYDIFIKSETDFIKLKEILNLNFKQ